MSFSSRILTALAVAAVVGGAAASADAASYTFTNPSLVSAPDGSLASPSTAEAKIGSGSWQANGVSSSEIILTPAMLGLSAFTIDDIKSLSWSVNSSHSADWYVSIYTDPYVGGFKTWYGQRLTFEGLYANNPNFTPGWITFSTDTGTNQVTGNDSNHSGNFGTAGQPTLKDYQDGPINGIDYGSQYVNHIRISTATGWASGYTGFLDNFNLELNGTLGSATVDFEAPAAAATAVPVPAAAYAGMSMLGAMGFGKWLRKRKQA
jgi:hypothetical protein